MVLGSLLLGGCSAEESANPRVAGRTQVSAPEGFELTTFETYSVLDRTEPAEQPTSSIGDAVVLGGGFTQVRVVEGIIVRPGPVPESAMVTVPCSDDGARTVVRLAYRDRGEGLELVADVEADPARGCSPVEMDIPLPDALSAAKSVPATDDFLAEINRG